METDCGTHGLNLSCADTAIYYSSPLGYEKRRQGQDRIIDIDKKNPPLVIDLICENTVDESLLKANKYKQKRIDIMKTIIDDMKGRN